jgi:hypothetical protein
MGAGISIFNVEERGKVNKPIGAPVKLGCRWLGQSTILIR